MNTSKLTSFLHLSGKDHPLKKVGKNRFLIKPIYVVLNIALYAMK